MSITHTKSPIGFSFLGEETFFSSLLPSRILFNISVSVACLPLVHSSMLSVNSNHPLPSKIYPKQQTLHIITTVEFCHLKDAIKSFKYRVVITKGKLKALDYTIHYKKILEVIFSHTFSGVESSLRVANTDFTDQI